MFGRSLFNYLGIYVATLLFSDIPWKDHSVHWVPKSGKDRKIEIEKTLFSLSVLHETFLQQPMVFAVTRSG